MELNLRLATEQRGHFTAAALLRGATNHASLGWPEAGRLEAGALADFVTVGLDSPRLETAEPETCSNRSSSPPPRPTSTPS